MRETGGITFVAVLVACIVAGSAGAREPAADRSHAPQTGLACEKMQLPHDECLQPGDADMAGRWIGKLEEQVQNCPPAQGWSASKLFGQGTLPAPLARYCLYESDNPTGPPDVPQNDFVALNPDSMSVTYSGALDDLVWRPFQRQFLEQVGELGADVVLEPDSTVIRLAIVDSQPDSGAPFLDPRPLTGSPHGHALVHMARDLLCEGNSPCGVHVTSTLGLAFRCPTGLGSCVPNEADGGWVSPIGWIATAIREAVVGWGNSTDAKLVINLSMGWNNRFDQTVQSIPLGARRVANDAVEDAIRDAVCRGAIVIAAAGNILGGPEPPEGPLWPARLEVDEAAPTPDECGALLLPDEFDPTKLRAGTPYAPLVYSVGGLRSDNTRLQDRLDGTPRLAAYADHGVGEVNDPRHSVTLTGTSVAALVASATAAAAWYYSPELTAQEIMDIVYRSGDALHDADPTLPRRADYCLDFLTGCPDAVQRVNLCAAVTESCEGDLDCPTAADLDCQTLRPTQPDLPIDAIVDAFDTIIPFSIALLTEPKPYDECNNGSMVWSAPDQPEADYPCPEFELYAVQETPWADGQPEGQNCPTCGGVYHSPGDLYMEISTAFDGQAPEPRLVCGENAYRLNALETGGLTPGALYAVTAVPLECATNTVATLSYRVTNGANPEGTVSSTSPPFTIKPDQDLDRIPDVSDNCTCKPNLDQRDSNGDGFGNVCDADLNDDGFTNFSDLGSMKTVFFTNDPDADLTGDGAVNFADLGVMKQLFFQPPGPAGDEPCPIP